MQPDAIVPIPFRTARPTLRPVETRPKYDLLLRGGTVIDPAQGLHGTRDVGISGNRVAEISDEIFEEEAENVIDVSGKLVTPGLIDLHVHIWWGVSHYGIEPDPHCVARGVTTAFDAGSAGADTFPGLKKYVIDVSVTEIRAFLHISSQGMLSQEIGEMTDLRYADVKKAIDTCETFRKEIVGVKIRMTKNLVGENGKEGLKRAREVSDATGLPLMVHPNASPLSFADMLKELRSGDIVTHCFHRSDTGILDGGGSLRPEARNAAEDGVLFDVGHGKGSFDFEVADAAIGQNFKPGTISSDLHRYNVGGPVHDLITTVSKFLHLGLSLDECIEKVTAAPARAMGMLGEIGTLRPGARADVAILERSPSRFEMTDTHNATRTVDGRLNVVSTIRNGRLYAPSAFDYAR